MLVISMESCVKIDVIDEGEIDFGYSSILEARTWITNVDAVQGQGIVGIWKYGCLLRIRRDVSPRQQEDGRKE